jgi:hypothetical protein
MSRMTDDDLGDLLAETFRDHEHLAIPDRAVAIAALPGRPARRGRTLLGAAAAVVLVAAGTTYAVTTGHGGREGTVKLGPSFPQTGSAEAVTRANRAIAERLADEALAQLRARADQLPGGPREVGAGKVPALTELRSFIGPGVGHGFTRSAFFLAPGEAHEVASWFAAHPPVGSSSESDPTAVGGSRNADGSWSDEAMFDYPSGPEISDHASLASLVQVTPQGSGVGIRVTVFGSYRPGRPAASFAHGVNAVEIRVTDWVIGRNGGRPTTTRHHWTLSSPTKVGRIVSRYDALPGGAAVGMSCPMPRATRTYRLTLQTSSGPLTVTGRTGCGAALSVRREGRLVPPLVDSGDFFGFLNRLLSLPVLPTF